MYALRWKAATVYATTSFKGNLFPDTVRTTPIAWRTPLPLRIVTQTLLFKRMHSPTPADSTINNCFSWNSTIPPRGRTHHLLSIGKQSQNPYHLATFALAVPIGSAGFCSSPSSSSSSSLSAFLWRRKRQRGRGRKVKRRNVIPTKPNHRKSPLSERGTKRTARCLRLTEQTSIISERAHLPRQIWRYWHTKQTDKCIL